MYLENHESELRMTADVNDIEDIKAIMEGSSSPITAEGQFIVDKLSGLGYEQVAPEDVGALTGAPLISDGRDVWGYMDYQVKSLLEELAAGNTVIWTKG